MSSLRNHRVHGGFKGVRRAAPHCTPIASFQPAPIGSRSAPLAGMLSASRAFGPTCSTGCGALVPQSLGAPREGAGSNPAEHLREGKKCSGSCWWTRCVGWQGKPAETRRLFPQRSKLAFTCCLCSLRCFLCIAGRCVFSALLSAASLCWAV